jgi:enoyl-CoA hydratase/carnithine racemase
VADLVRVAGGRVATITLARPQQRNALNAAMLTAFADALSTVAADADARCILLEGEGTHFCAGADFGDVTEGAEKGARYGGAFEAMLRGIEEHPLPVVAKVQGAALGAGCQVLAACDLAVAADDAKIGIPSARLGILLDLEKIDRLVRVVGAPTVRRMLLAGHTFNGTEAAACGLATRAVPAPDLDAAVASLADEVASCAPLSVRGSKAGIRTVLDHAALSRDADPAAFGAHDEAALAALTSADLVEGLTALRERRPPDFRGL